MTILADTHTSIIIAVVVTAALAAGDVAGDIVEQEGISEDNLEGKSES